MIEQAIILPAYLEIESIQQTIRDLQLNVTEPTLFIVVDDSPDFQSGKAARDAWRLNEYSELVIISNKVKMGRGAAVLGGLRRALEEPAIVKIIEMDSDGSHRPEDVVRVSQLIKNNQIVIGSRYLPDSRIIGWPMSRRVFSKVLNSAIPKLFRIKATDCTNGLRGYSKLAAESLVSSPQRTRSFIYLTESLLILSRDKFGILEVPIIFRDRTLGSSTVTYKELLNSLKGLVKLFIIKSRI